MAGSPGSGIKKGGFKNFLASNDKDKAAKKAQHLQVLRSQAREATGSFLEAPVTDTKKIVYEHPGPPAMVCGEATMQGWRRANEDAAAIVLSLPRNPTVACLGVFDGHGGDKVAKCVAKHLPGLVDDRIPGDLKPEGIQEALQKAFVAMDACLCDQLQESERDTTGATCNVVVITPSHFVCANAGDARSVLCVLGESAASDVVTPLSRDHSPSSPREQARITAAGSSVDEEGRIDGMLNVARAMGDFSFKSPDRPAEANAVTCAADTTVVPRGDAECFVVQACDGIWGAKTSDEVCAFIAAQLRAGNAPHVAAENLCAAVLAPEFSDTGVGTDNMSVNVLKIAKR